MLGPSEILVVEDSPDSVVVLANALTRTFPGARLTLAGSIREFHSRMAGLGALDLAVVDLGLPDGSGHEVIDCVRAHWPEAQILVYTLFDDDGNLFEALKKGANGYLLKFDPPARLIAALRAIMDGEPPLSPKIALRMLREFTHMGRVPRPEDHTDAEADNLEEEHARDDSNLTPRELETLTLTAKGLRLPDLAENLGVTRSTAATYLKRIYRKLGVNSRAEATTEAVRMGLVKIARGTGG
ncbi:MAG: response regulator transcription factor [Pseudomonadota bacterium]|nr:response regulator transcription factor [Pseudomonadota bacterium]